MAVPGGGGRPPRQIAVCVLRACPRRWSGVAALAATLLCACSSMDIDGQWTDPRHPPVSLRGATLLVVCEAEEQLVRQLCQERLATELNAAGARAVVATQALDEGPASSAPGRYLPAARQAGATVVFHTVVLPADSYERSGFSVGFGIGGRLGGGGFGGVGVSAPFGGPRITQQYAANGSLSEVADGRLMWSAKASARAGDELRVQVDSLGKALVASARKAGFF